MEAVWFAIVAGMLAVYTVLDGYDFGVGMLHRLVARTDAERRTVFAAIGPGRYSALVAMMSRKWSGFIFCSRSRMPPLSS